MAEKDVNVKVVLHAPGSNPVFHFESNDLPIDGDNVIYFDNCGSYRGFRIRYNLDTTNNAGFRFPTRAANGNDYLDHALWVAQSATCPAAACQWPVFEARREENGGGTLVVKNTNGDVENFAYTLRVTNGTTWLNLDPVGSNRNGGSPLNNQKALLLGVLGLVAGAIVGTYLIAPALS